MIQFICLFFPTFISMAIMSSIYKEKFNVTKFVIMYGSFNIIINFVALVITSYVFHRNNSIVLDLGYTNIACVKYLLLTICLSILIPIIFEIFRLNIKLKIQVEEEIQDEKKS